MSKIRNLAMPNPNERVPMTAEMQDLINRLPMSPLSSMIPMPKPNPCTWTKDEDGIWTSSCHRKSGEGPSFCFEVDGPQGNRFQFCPYCGKPLVEAKTAE